MADRTTGPVKPPVIDLTARTAGARADAERPTAANDAGRSSRRRFDPGAFLAGNWRLVTAGLGVLVLAVMAFLFFNRPAGPDLAPELTSQSERIDALETELKALKGTADGTQAAADATASRLDTGLADLGRQLADIKAAIPAPAAAVDLTPIETELKTLKSQVDAIAAGASGTDAGAIAQSLSDVEAALATLGTRLDGLDKTTAALRSDLDATRKALSDHVTAALPNEIGPALKLPLILSGLEAAFAGGRPFAPELAGLTSVLPDLAVSSPLKAAAATGLSRPDTLMQRFEAALPDILAARESKSGDWVQNAVDWVRSLLAIRPAGEVEGDSPEAVVSRLEGAMGRRDYEASLALLRQLPAPMQAEAAPIADDIAVHADADALVRDLRARALASAETPQ